MLNKNTMKKFLSLVFVAWSMFLVGCSQPATTEETSGASIVQRQVYENSDAWFSLQYPSAWTIKENVYGATVMFSSPLTDGDTISENVSVVKKVLENTYTPLEYYEINKAEIVKAITDFSEISNEEILINGIVGQKVVYEWVQGATDLQMLQVYFIKDGTSYVVTYTATKKTFDDFVQQADEMIASLVIN